MEIARAIVVATPGAEDRPWSTVGSTPKPLVPIAGKPILFHTLDALCAAGVLEVALLTEPRSADVFSAAIGDGRSWGMKLSYMQCPPDTNIGGALRTARDFVDGEPVLVQRADVLLRRRLREHIVDFARDDLDALALMLMRVHDQAPPAPRRAGGYLLSPAAVSITLGDGPAGRDPLDRLRRQGSHVRVLDVEGCLACDGGEASLLAANRLALGAITTRLDAATSASCELQGTVSVDPTASLENTLVRGPAIIGARSRLVDCYVGPYTAVGADVRIEGTEIEHSIVMDGAQLLFIGSRLESSIIGRGASIVRHFDMPNAVRVAIGDGAQVSLS